MGSAPTRDNAGAAWEDSRDLLRGVTGATTHPEGNPNSVIPPICTQVATILDPGKRLPNLAISWLGQNETYFKKEKIKKKTQILLLWLACLTVL